MPPVITKSYLKLNACYLDQKYIVPKGLMLHSVGSGHSSPLPYILTWNNPFRDVCVHAFIDANSGVVYQTLPWDMRGWHCGAQANNTHIGVEMCEPDSIKYTSGTSFTCSDLDKARQQATHTFHVAADLFAELCISFRLNPAAPGVIISHSEGAKAGIASNHADPEHLWRGLGMYHLNMNSFRELVYQKMSNKPYTYLSGRNKSDCTQSSNNNYTQSEIDAAYAIVRDGAYGTGNERIENLKRAGLDPDKVQPIVNDIMNGKKPTYTYNSSGAQRTKLTYAQVADQIYTKGNWGNGNERITKLKNAGYNENEIKEIQNIVNGKFTKK